VLGWRVITATLGALSLLAGDFEEVLAQALHLLLVGAAHGHVDPWSPTTTVNYIAASLVSRSTGLGSAWVF